MDKKYDALVFIGRFQPFHNAHLKIIEYAKKISKKVIVIVGSSNQPRTFKNPFSFDERKNLIEQSIWARSNDSSNENQILTAKEIALSGFRNASVIKIEPIVDTMYNENSWVTRVQNIVNQNSDSDSKIGIIGHKKDESSYYLDMFPQWDLVEVDLVEELSASQIRELYFKENFNANFIGGVVPQKVLDYLLKFSKTEQYTQIIKEVKFVEKYKSQYASFPYPPTFVTVDAVVVQSGHVLMIRRRAEPGKGLLAIPGGFLDALTDKSIEDAMIRELREETCLKVPDPVLRGNITNSRVFDAIDRSTRGRTITHAFYINLPDGKLPKVKNGSDAASAQWIPISQVDSSECYEDHYEIINYFTGV